MAGGPIASAANLEPLGKRRTLGKAANVPDMEARGSPARSSQSGGDLGSTSHEAIDTRSNPLSSDLGSAVACPRREGPDHQASAANLDSLENLGKGVSKKIEQPDNDEAIDDTVRKHSRFSQSTPRVESSIEPLPRAERIRKSDFAREGDRGRDTSPLNSREEWDKAHHRKHHSSRSHSARDAAGYHDEHRNRWNGHREGSRGADDQRLSGSRHSSHRYRSASPRRTHQRRPHSREPERDRGFERRYREDYSTRSNHRAEDRSRPEYKGHDNRNRDSRYSYDEPSRVSRSGHGGSRQRERSRSPDAHRRTRRGTYDRGYRTDYHDTRTDNFDRRTGHRNRDIKYDTQMDKDKWSTGRDLRRRR